MKVLLLFIYLGKSPDGAIEKSAGYASLRIRAQSPQNPRMVAACNPSLWEAKMGNPQIKLAGQTG